MKSHLNWQTNQNLDSLHPAPAHTSFWSKINDIWQLTLAYLAVSAEPHVWLSKNAAGLPQWKAYDPLTGQTAEYSSDAEMRIWLEERHYQY